MLFSAVLAGPQAYGILAVLGFGLLLPPIAILHARFAGANAHGTLLSTIAGTATAVTGLAALLLNDLEPAALFFLGLWWWTAGRLATEAVAFPRAFALATSALGVIAFLASLADIFGVRIAWSAARLLLAAWLVVLTWLLRRKVP